ncbi:tetratricopeptide repeat protein [Paracoccaceae bacterium]|nr:tetratricopeptide repeat protein [Paracoccaceae bacterium]
MELTLDQALQKGIEAHKAGQIQKADRLYTAILTARPKHPDANHNMGVLAVGVGKVQEALPFFKTALEATPSIEQFWLSYIDALIKLNRLADARAVIDQAKSKGAKGDGFDQLDKKLLQTAEIGFLTSQKSVFNDAVKLRENGKYNQAIDLLKSEITKFPQDPNMLALLSHCYILNENIEEAIIHLNTAKVIDPSNALVGWNDARLLLKTNKVGDAVTTARNTNKRFPDDVQGMGVLGSCLRASNDIVESLVYLDKAIQLNPHYAEALISRGLIHLAKEDKSAALVDLEKAHKLKLHYKQIWDLVISIKVDLEQFSEAISLIKEMIKLLSKNEKLFATMAFCHQRMGHHEAAIEAYYKALAIKPDYAEAYNNIGISLKELSRLDESVKAYNKALAIKPDYAEAYNNMGTTLKEQEKLEEAKEAYNKALTIKPDSAEIYKNIGNILKEQGNLEDAITVFKKATELNPYYAEAYTNMSLTLLQTGNLRMSQEILNRALMIDAEYGEAIDNFFNLNNQLLGVSPNFYHMCKHINKNLTSKTLNRPKYQLQNAIRSFLLKDFTISRQHLKKFTSLEKKVKNSLAPKDQDFCNAYNHFLSKLLEEDDYPLSEFLDASTIYHIGESHCLSYAHRKINSSNANFTVIPKIIFGAKAFHFAAAGYGPYKAITKANLTSIPKNSEVFVSFGEIDCRLNEGFIPTAKKLQKPIKDLISETVAGYVRWFRKQNESLNHNIRFFNVPAPTTDRNFNVSENMEVANTVALFNSEIEKFAEHSPFNLIDVYRFTVGETGFSNGLYHIDKYHLGAKAILEIEKQLN